MGRLEGAAVVGGLSAVGAGLVSIGVPEDSVIRYDSAFEAAFFLAGTGGPDNPQFAPWSIFASVEAFGPMASRPNDRMGVSGWFNVLSDKFADLASGAGDFLDNLWGVEIYYNFAINQYLHLTPDLQFVQNEKVSDNVASIPGIRLVIDV